jgi:proteasome lid subunit RPN8/RPN11
VSEVRLVPAARHGLEQAARSPIETCGGLLGIARGCSLTVTQILPCSNRDDGGDAFALALDELFDTRRRYFSPDPLVGIYHSHPNADAAPSPLDRYYLSLFSWVWVIVGGSPKPGVRPRIAAYVHHRGEPIELPVGPPKDD